MGRVRSPIFFLFDPVFSLFLPLRNLVPDYQKHCGRGTIICLKDWAKVRAVIKLHCGISRSSFRGRTASNKILWKIKDMGFGDIKNRSGLEALNTYLEHNSYIEGYVSCFCSLLNAYKKENMFRPRAFEVISYFFTRI